ncbi:MAG: MarR family transcriptional regulator [Acidimicrobiia bacterium]|nr:MarR family transcriptional regulator [Acidimicrobiia bacterium]
MTTVKIKTTPASDAWRNVMTAFTRVNTVLGREMSAEAAISLDWYSILLMLAQSEEASMRPSDLADQIGLSRSATTRLVDRLESEGLVERRSCASDRRGTFVRLTPKGAQVFTEAGRIHLRGIDEHVGSHLTNDELAQVAVLLGKLAHGVGGDALSVLNPAQP